MSAVTLVRTALLADASLSAAVSGVLFRFAPDDQALPFITLTPVSDEPINAFSGEAATKNERIQIDIWSKTYGEADSIKGLLIDALDAPASFKAIRVGTNPAFESDTDLHRVSVDYSIWY